MIRRLLAACAGLVLLQTQAIAGTQYIGTISMSVCDGGEDLCGNTLTSSLIDLPAGSFTEDFVFDLVNDFPDIPDNFPLLQATAVLETSIPAFRSASVQLYESSGAPIGFSTPFVPNGSHFQALAEDVIHSGAGLYVEVSGVSNADRLPLQVSVSAFDLGPVVVPEPSTWAMMLLGLAGLGFAARRRTSPALAGGKSPLPSDLA